jgi:hypothetical protein
LQAFLNLQFFLQNWKERRNFEGDMVRSRRKIEMTPLKENTNLKKTNSLKTKKLIEAKGLHDRREV